MPYSETERYAASGGFSFQVLPARATLMYIGGARRLNFSFNLIISYK